ncbi:MAG: hypothetical protein CMN30_33060 [Sandaracinus sp.]|nr:hypothetical protein [Sandaracinus sp.]
MKLDLERFRSPEELLDDEEGAVFAEYVVILILVVVAAVLVWQGLHDSIVDDAKAEYTTFGYPP